MISLLFSRMSGRKWVRKLWDGFLSLGAYVSKEGRSGPVRTEYIKSELTPGDGTTKKSRFWLGFGRFQKYNWWFYVACREFLVMGDGVDGVELVHCL